MPPSTDCQRRWADGYTGATIGSVVDAVQRVSLVQQISAATKGSRLASHR